MIKSAEVRRVKVIKEEVDPYITPDLSPSIIMVIDLLIIFVQFSTILKVVVSEVEKFIEQIPTLIGQTKLELGFLAYDDDVKKIYR